MSDQPQSAAPPPPMTGAPLALAAVALALGTFMQVLDSTIANVSIPTIAGNLGVSADQGTWVITSFAVANGISIPLTGWLMQRFGVVKTFVASVALFTIASFLCGISWSLETLVAFRVLQGGVSGPLIPGSQALLLSIFPASRRSTALAIWSMTTLVAPVAGPILGGYISDNWSWPWIFFINLPVGAVCAVACWRLLASRETPSRRLPIDRVGFMLLAVWVGALQITLDLGKDADWFASTKIVVLSLVAAVGFVAWVIWETTDEHPVVDLSLFKSRNFLLGTLTFCLGYALFFGNNLLLPLWLQTQLDYTATWAGLVSAPSGVVAVILTPITARLFSRVDARWSATISIAAFCISYFMRASFNASPTFGVLVMPILFQGVGMSMYFVAMLTIILQGVTPARMPAASGLTNFARNTAGSFAASLTTTMWDRRETLHQSRLAEYSSVYDPNLTQSLAQLDKGGFASSQGLGLLVHNLINQAYMVSTIDLFWMSAWLSVAMIPLVWLARRAFSHGGASAAAD